MRQRITYLIRNAGASFNPSQLQVKNDQLEVHGIQGAKEHRLTIGLSELPPELSIALQQCHELHIRWASPNARVSVAPFTSQLSPGLHAFFTPQKRRAADRLCQVLKNVFDEHLKCDSPEESFIAQSILSERFSMSSSSQYYELVPSLKNLATYVQAKLCPTKSSSCQDEASSLLSASYFDVDYDTISHAIVVNVFWGQPSNASGWSETISKSGKSEIIEVGVLSNEKSSEAEELRLGGYLIVLGEDESPKETLFDFPSRHHPLPKLERTPQATYWSSFRHPTGLHPTLELTFPTSSLIPPAPSCALHTYLTLPSSLFMDRYQLSDPLFLSSNNLRSLRSLAGATDLEAPDWVVSQWGSTALLELSLPDSDSAASKRSNFTVSIPLHLRYLPPQNSSNEALDVAWPPVFWACAADEGSKFPVNPFDRVNLGYDGLFGPKTMFYHVPPAPVPGRQMVQRIQVPVLDLSSPWADWIEYGTVGAVVLGFAAVCWTLGRTWMRSGVEKRRGKGAKAD